MRLALLAVVGELLGNWSRKLCWGRKFLKFSDSSLLNFFKPVLWFTCLHLGMERPLLSWFHQHLFVNSVRIIGEMSHLVLSVSFLGQFLTDTSPYGPQQWLCNCLWRLREEGVFYFSLYWSLSKKFRRHFLVFPLRNPGLSNFPHITMYRTRKGGLGVVLATSLNVVTLPSLRKV